MRRISAAVTVAALTAVMGAAAAQATPPTPSPDGSTQVRATGSAVDGSGHLKKAGLAASSPRTADSPQRLSGVEATPAVTEMSSLCPTGQMFGREYGTESFEAGLPDPDSSNGWDQVTGTGAPDGAAWAKSVVTAAEQDADHFLAGLDAAIPSSGKVYAYFAYRTNTNPDPDVNNAVFWAGDEGYSLRPAVDWTYVILDVSSEVASYPGHMFIDFEHYGVGVASDEAFEVDDVGVYSCVAIPNAGVRGDWTGEGAVDLLVTNGGNLYLYPGYGNGTVGRSRYIGSGWGGFTWLASPGDVNGDRRSDLLARNAAGELVLYAGRGNAAFYSGKVVGSGWNVMTAIATPGDMNLDGRPELLARRTDGTLHLYTFSATGAISRVKQVGAGWNTTRHIIGRGDLNGDRRGDLLAVRTDGTLWAYLTSSTMTFGKATQVGSGWGAMDLVSSPGDMNKDGYNDLVARRASDGSLFFYPGRTAGTFGKALLLGPGWAPMTNIL